MSYSFVIKATDKKAALSAVSSELENVVVGQPIHQRDRAVAMATAEAILNLVDDPQPGFVISVAVNGYVSWEGVLVDGKTDNPLRGASVGVSANLMVV